MAKMGKRQQSTRRFGFVSILGFSVASIATWPAILVVFVYQLQNGGLAGLVIGFLIVWAGYACVVASLCEMMSMSPTSGGQYHWTYTFAPARFAAFLSYTVGWQSVLARQAVIPSVTYLAATMVQGLIVLHNPDYDYQRWQGTLLVYAFFLCAIGNTVFVRCLPHFESFTLWIYIAASIATLVTVTVMSPHKATTTEVFQTFYNTGKWPTQGLSFFVGIQGTIFAWLGCDGAIHMSEEIKDASIYRYDGVLAFATLLAVLFCGGNLLDALESPTGYPIEAIFTYASGSVAGGTGLSVLLVFFCFSTIVSLFAASSRELWAFARDRGGPGSSVLMRIHHPSRLPLWTMLVTTMVVLLLALINIGSAEAFNAILSLTVSTFLASYTIPLTLILYRRIQAHRGKSKQLPWGPWRLGKWGIVINAIGLAWSIVLFFFAFWPPVVDPAPAEMNWNCLAWGVMTLFAVPFWFVDGRKRYKGPIRDAAGGEIEQVIVWDSVNDQ